MKKKYKILTLGCRTNQYESQAYKNQLAALGYEEAKDKETAQICVLNTCTVTAQADKSSQSTLKQLIKKHPQAKILVTGCAVEGMGKKDLLEGLSDQVQVVANQEKDKLLPLAFPELSFPEFEIRSFEGHTRAFVKVQDGCNSFCSYCIIPYVRGRSRSRTGASVVEEVRQLVANGYKDIVLTGINIGDFDGGASLDPQQKKQSLAELIKEVDAVEGLKRLRVSSIDPDEVDEELVSAILNGKHTCPSMHIVLQSGSNAVLKRMNRKYTKQMFFETIDFLKSKSPDFTFTTDIIVGFPGETEFDHKETLEAIEKTGFLKVHMFPYSVRERTKAALFTDQVSDAIKTQRKLEILHLSEKVAFQARNAYLNQERVVLLESKVSDDGEMIFGHSDNFLPVWVKVKGLKANQELKVRLVANTPEALIGEVVTL